MITLTVEGQQRARDALKRLDQAITTDRETQETVWKHAHNFRDTFFETFGLIERESLSLNEIMLKMQRIDANKLQVANKNLFPFLLILDPELAYHTRYRTTEDKQTGETQTHHSTELAARLFAVFEPPTQGVIRYYTIFGDGSWKRTSFTIGTDGGLVPQSAMAAAASPDVLMLEAIDLLGKACTLHPTWAELTAPDTLIADKLRDRALVKIHLTGR